MTDLPAPLDLLAIYAHPDDAELFCGGTLALVARQGRRAGILNLTRGELATRGKPELRAREAMAAAEILGLAHLETLDLDDGDLANTQGRRVLVAEAIRRLRPGLIVTHGQRDRHPDHRRAHELVRDATFMANVGGFPAQGERWRTPALAYTPGNTFDGDAPADWVVDITETHETKMAALRAYSSQFLGGENDPNPTYIASEGFWKMLEERMGVWGHRIGARYGEPFLLDCPAHAAHPLVALTA
jgi:bacillithiol biosynthesis deacetylase BshB1